MSILFSSSGDLANTMISSAKITEERCSPSMMRPPPSQSILFMIASWRHDVKILGDMLSRSCSPLQLDFFTVPMEFQSRAGTVIVQVS